MSSHRSKFMALLAAFLGWMFDGFEMGLFPLIGKPALKELLPAASDIDRSQWFAVIIAVFLVGAATGGVLFGWLGDKLGRVKAMSLAIFTYAIFTGAWVFVKEPWHFGPLEWLGSFLDPKNPAAAQIVLQFAALRFIASLGMGGEWSLGVALVNELWAGKNRAWIAGMIGAASNVGFLMTGILSLTLKRFIDQLTHALGALGVSQGTSDFLMHNNAWRCLAIGGALPALINFFILFLVPESHKWEEEKKAGKTSHWETKDLLGVLVAAVAVLAIICVWAPTFKKGMAVSIAVTVVGIALSLWGYLLPVRRYVGRSAAAHDAVPGAHAHVVRKLLLGAGLAGVALLGTWGSAQQAPKWSSGLLPEGSGVPMIEYCVIATALGAILVTLITPLIADLLGRRVTYTLLCLAAFAASVAFFKLNTPFKTPSVPLFFWVSAFLMGGITASFYGYFPLYFPELFPTSVRATGQGFCFNFGRVIAAIGGLQLSNLVGVFHTEANAYCILCCIYVVGMIMVWFCPETKGKALL